jgi:hypothetical protein
MPGVPSSPFSSLNVELLASTTAAATASGSTFGVDRFTAFTVRLNVSAASGTSPTLNVYIQKLVPNGSRPSTVWHDIISFTQLTTTGTRISEMVEGGNAEVALSQAALAAGTVQNALIGSYHRVHYVIGGTNPSFTFSVYADYKE